MKAALTLLVYDDSSSESSSDDEDCLLLDLVFFSKRRLGMRLNVDDLSNMECVEIFRFVHLFASARSISKQAFLSRTSLSHFFCCSSNSIFHTSSSSLLSLVFSSCVFFSSSIAETLVVRFTSEGKTHILKTSMCKFVMQSTYLDQIFAS